MKVMINKASRFFPFLIYYPIILFFLLITVLDRTSPLAIPIVQRKALAIDTIAGSGSTTILKEADKIVIKSPSFFMRFFAPRDFFIDPMYEIMLLVYFILIPVYFWEFSYQRPFNRETIIGIRITLWFTLIFMIANFCRYEWVNKQIETISLGQYGFNKGLTLIYPEFILFLILVRLTIVFKKGYRLQQELDLTI